jgi:hypothetical protein
MAAVRDVLARADAALDALARRGEAVEDEWTYVEDLEGAWRERFREVEAARGDEPATAHAVAAVERAITETELIEDPHRAIDWLSTFPQVVLLALGEAG